MKPCQVRAPAEMLEVRGRGGAVGLLKLVWFFVVKGKGGFLKRKRLVCGGS
ncbi:MULTISPECIES: hypothetical protein [unclassified Bartonella]|uniref:hypothetical protein n=1 Tax=unclassified Bartonella TaxID=2645622 RepID=UPI0035CFC51C